MRVLGLHTRYCSERRANLILTLYKHSVSLRTEFGGEIRSKFGKRFAKTVYGEQAARALFETLKTWETENLYQLTQSPEG
jgi:hypothetical protein